MTAYYSASEVARMLKMSEKRLRGFVRDGILGTRDPEGKQRVRFDFRDMLVLRMAARLMEHGLSSQRVKKALRLLQEQVRSSQPLSGLQLFAEGGRLVASDGNISWEPESGQQRLRFDVTKSEGDRPERLGRDDTAVVNVSGLPKTAEGWFELAMQWEDCEPHRAYEAYLKTLEADPEHLEAYINVGRLCSAAGEFERAAAFFRQAIRVDPTHPVAHFNLAVTLHDIGELDPAREAYRAAIAHDPHFADAHYNLAALLEQQGDREGAQRHRQLYQAVSLPLESET